MAHLRNPEVGCPWDIEQDFQSIVSSTLEECYELIDAIEREDFDNIEEELGDVLFQVIFYAQMGRERSFFDFFSIVDVLVRKLIRRHPHVFSISLEQPSVSADASQRMNSDEVKNIWENIKAEERSSRVQQSALDDIPSALPSLSRAQKVQNRASRQGFDWDSYNGPLNKIEEEIMELKESLTGSDLTEIKMELGDLLFSCVNLSRHLNLDSEEVLRHATKKFETRFKVIENELSRSNRSMRDLSNAEHEFLWDKAKLSES